VAEAAALHAGVACVPLAPPLGVPLMGYGARQGVALATHDPLFARALHLRSTSGGAPRSVLMVALDVCLLAPAQALGVRERIAAATGLPVAAITVAATHTHSGPDTGLGDALEGRPPAPHVAALLDAAVRAGEEAIRTAGPATLGTGRAEAAIGRNRRRADGPLDSGVTVVRVDRANGAPLAVLYSHGCHPTALGHDNLEFSADWPGAASRRIEAELPGARAIFLLGAHADVDPRTRGLQDVALEGQSVGVGFDVMEALGDELGAAVALAAQTISTSPHATVDAASRLVTLVTHPGSGSAEERARRLEAGRRAALEVLGLDPAQRVRSQELFELAHARTAGLSLGVRRETIARVRRDLRDRQAAWFAGGAEVAVEVQALRLGPVRWLALPLEATVDVGLDWQARARGPAAVLSIANGWLRYLPHGRNFSENHADQGYEVLTSTFVAEAAERLLSAGHDLFLQLEARPSESDIDFHNRNE